MRWMDRLIILYVCVILALSAGVMGSALAGAMHVASPLLKLDLALCLGAVVAYGGWRLYAALWEE